MRYKISESTQKFGTLVYRWYAPLRRSTALSNVTGKPAGNSRSRKPYAVSIIVSSGTLADPRADGVRWEIVPGLYSFNIPFGLNCQVDSGTEKSWATLR